jgi:hypothetical protein
MRPALSVIDLIPNIHRTPALAALRRAVLEGRPATFRLTDEDRELAFHDAHVQLTSPIGARVLRTLYDNGHLKLKKPATKTLPALEAYIATEAVFRSDVTRIIAQDDAKRRRLAEIIANPTCAQPEEISPYLIDKVMSAHLGHTATGIFEIGGIECHRSQSGESSNQHTRDEDQLICWWVDGDGQRHGDPS